MILKQQHWKLAQKNLRLATKVPQEEGTVCVLGVQEEKVKATQENQLALNVLNKTKNMEDFLKKEYQQTLSKLRRYYSYKIYQGII